MKKIFLFLILGMLILVGNVSAFNFDNVKSYETLDKYGEITITNAFGLGDTLAEYTLEENTDQCLTNCYSKGTAKLYSDGKLFSDLRFKDRENKYKEIKKSEIYIWKEEIKEIVVIDYKDNCYFNIKNNSEICEEIKVGEHIENKIEGNWILYDEKELKEGTYEWKIIGEKDIDDKIDWIASAFGEDFTEWAWWNTDWVSCNNLTLSGAVGVDNTILYKNITDIVFSNTTEIRIVNKGCGLDGSEVKSTILKNGSNWAYVTFLANTSDTTYSVYTNNPTNPAKSSALELVDDFCEFEGNNCGWTNGTNGFVYSFNNGIMNFSGSGLSGIYHNNNIGLKSILLSQRNYATSGIYLTSGISTATGGFPAFATNHSIGSMINLGGGQFRFHTQNASSEFTYDLATSGMGLWLTYWLSANSTGSVNGSLYNSTSFVNSAISTTRTTNSSMHLNIGGQDTFAVAQQIDYIRAYDIESVYTNSPPTITQGADENSNQLVLTLNSPVNYYNSSSSSITFNASATDEIGVLNLSLFIDGSRNYTLNGGVGQNLSFEVSRILSDGTHNWTAETCDSEKCIINSNRTLTIDQTKPVINITSPYNSINYHIKGTNLTINWTVSDDNLGSCWWSMNRGITNNSVICLNNNISINITSINQNNFTLWANDTFGNSNYNYSLWDYKIFQNSISYSNEAIEGSLESFILNISITPSLQLSTGSLIYNGSSYSSSWYEIGNNFILRKNITIPGTIADTNMSFYWIVNLSDYSSINTTNYNQTVKNLLIGNCTSYSTKIFNFTIIDEELQTKINTNTTIDFYMNLLSKEGSSLLNFSKLYDDINPAEICININLTSSSEYYVKSIIRYLSDDHEIEYYNLINYTLKNSTIPEEIYLYDLDSADSTDFLISFRDDSFLAVEGALVFIQRQYISENNTFKTVELPITDENGQTVVHLVEKDIIYNIIVKDSTSGQILGYFNNIIAFCEDSTIGDCAINLNSYTSGEEVFNYDDSLKISYTTPIFNHTSRVLSIGFSTYDGSAKTVQMLNYKFDMLGNTTACNNSLTSSSGTLSCVIPNSIGNSTIYFNIYVDGDLIITDYINLDEDDYGNEGYFFLLILIISLVMMFLDSKAGMLIGVLIGLIAGILLSVIKGGIIGLGSSMIWLIVVIIIMVWKLSKENDS